MHPAQTLTERLFVSRQECAEVLGVDVRTVGRAIEDGQIPAVRAGARVLIPTAWLRKQARLGGGDAPAA